MLALLTRVARRMKLNINLLLDTKEQSAWNKF